MAPVGSRGVAILGEPSLARSLRRDLVAFWKLDEPSGTRYDAVGANHLADNNTVTQAAGKLGNAAQCTSANSEFLSIADNAALSMGDIDFTVSAWVYLDGKAAAGAIISKNAGATGEYELYYSSVSDRFVFYGESAGGSGSATANALGSPSLSTWYFLLGWHDAANDTLNIQANTGSINTNAYTLGIRDGAGAFQIGAEQGPAIFINGRIDAVGVWKRLLTAPERDWLYNGGAGREYPFR